jgi:NADH:ubiquinone oxidoreductase subunit K
MRIDAITSIHILCSPIFTSISLVLSNLSTTRNFLKTLATHTQKEERFVLLFLITMAACEKAITLAIILLWFGFHSFFKE